MLKQQPRVSPDLVQLFKESARVYDETYISRLRKTASIANAHQIVEPTISWAQDLRHVYMEVKLAHRFDAPGCANHTDTVIKISEKSIDLQVVCDAISSKIKYVLGLELYGGVVDTAAAAELAAA